MEPVQLATMFAFFWIAAAAYALDSDWQSAHATFYGGSDASGTMGKFTVRQNSSLMDVWLGIVMVLKSFRLNLLILQFRFNAQCWLSNSMLKLI
jgi:hypothetical protein